MSMGKRNNQIADDAAICVAKLKHSYTAAEIAVFSRDQLNGETIPTGTIIHNSTTDKMQVYDGSAWQNMQVHRVAIQIGVDVQVPVSQAAVVFATAFAPVDGTVVGVQALATAVADTASFAIQNLDLSGGAGDICATFPALANSTEGKVVDGALHGTAANLVVNKDDRFQVKITTDGSGTIDDLMIVIDIAESI